MVAFVGVDLNSLVVFAWIDLISIYHLRRTVYQAMDYKPPAVRGGHGCCDSSLGPPLTPLYPSTRYVTLCRVEIGVYTLIIACKTASLEGETLSPFIAHKNWSFENGVWKKSLAKQKHRAGERVKLKDGSRKSSLSLLS